MRTILTTLHSKYIHNSLALPCLVAYCGEECGELLIREFTTHEPRESVLAMLLAEEPDVVAFSVYLWNRRETLDLVDALSAARPNLRLVLGGPEVSFEDESLFREHPGLTALICGEGEIPFKDLLGRWANGLSATEIPRTLIRTHDGISCGPDSPRLEQLDDIPSPFQLGLTDFSRGFVYYETSRGCPYKCSFCLSAHDDRVRSYSMKRIQQDLSLLMKNKVAKVKLVDRTFNYDAKRARAIFQHILNENRGTHFHFEIGAHLLDEETLCLLETVPGELLQFEIGVQSTLEGTLDAVNRKVSLDTLENNVRRLLASNRIHLHLDLVAGLPGEDFSSFLASIDRVIALGPHHLQIEPVKLLPGSPLRAQVEEHGISFDPNPPYTILGSPDLDFSELQRLKEISRMLDLTYNSGCFAAFLERLDAQHDSFAKGLNWLAGKWHARGLFRFPLNRQAIYHHLYEIVSADTYGRARDSLIEGLAYDYARHERVVTNRIPAFFNTELTPREQAWVRNTIRERTDAIKGQGIKLQYFAAAFHSLSAAAERSVHLFLYLTQAGEKMKVEEYID